MQFNYPSFSGQDKPKCPFLGVSMSAQPPYEGSPNDCIQEKCMFWNADEGHCRILEWYVLSNHWHDQHKHKYAHAGKDKEVGPPYGRLDEYMFYKIPKASTLVTEYAMKEDMDSDGLVYGKDFKITNDEDAPSVLTSLESSPDWKEPSAEINWNDYLDGSMPSTTPIIESVEKAVDSSNGDQYCILYGKFFENSGFVYPYNPINDPYPGIEPSDTSSHTAWVIRKEKWEDNRGGEITWEEWYVQNPIRIILENSVIPMARVYDHRFNRIIFKVTPIEDLNPAPPVNTPLDVALTLPILPFTVLTKVEKAFTYDES